MAKKFKLIDYDKFGKGVDKDAPQKRRAVVFFEVLFRNFWPMIKLNLLYGIAWFLPVIAGILLANIFGETIGDLPFYVGIAVSILFSGPLTTGLEKILRNMVREEESFLWEDYKGTVKSNWKQGLFASVINGVIYGLLAYGAFFYFSNLAQGTLYAVLFGLVLVTGLFFTFMQYYVFLMIVSCALPLKTIYKNAAILAFSGLPRNFLLSLFVIPAVGAIIFFGSEPLLFLYIILPVMLIIGFALGGFVINFVAYPYFQKMIIEPYYREHPDEITDSMRTWGYMDHLIKELEEDAKEPVPVIEAESDDDDDE